MSKHEAPLKIAEDAAMSTRQSLNDLIVKAERICAFRSLSINNWKPNASMHQSLTRHVFWKEDRDYNTHNLSDDEFSEISDWFEQEGWLATRQLPMKGSDNELFYLSPLYRSAITEGYHATRTASLIDILKEGLLRGNRDRSTSKLSDRRDQIGNSYVAERLGSPGDEANGKKGTAYWWREHKSHENCFGGSAWSILRLDFKGLSNLRLYADPWSHTGLILRSIIPPSRIEQVA